MKADLAGAAPYGEWLRDTQYQLEELPAADAPAKRSEDPAELRKAQQAFGFTDEDLKLFLSPMAANGDDPIGSMGNDIPIAVLSERAKLLYDSLKQHLAQVTTPPNTPIPEHTVLSL